MPSLAGKRAEQQARHARYHDTAYNLEPNLKDGPGGLRDLQSVVWIARRQLGLGSFEALRDATLLSPEEYAALAAARRKLWRIRYALHVQARRGKSVCCSSTSASSRAGSGSRTSTRRTSPSSSSCRATTVAAMTVERLNERLLQRLDELREAPPGGALAEPVDDDFIAVGAYLDVREADLFQRRPAAALRAFRVLLDRPDLQGLRSTCWPAWMQRCRCWPPRCATTPRRMPSS